MEKKLSEKNYIPYTLYFGGVQRNLEVWRTIYFVSVVSSERFRIWFL